MGIDCKISLPPAARLRDVAIALVRATGGTSELRWLENGHHRFPAAHAVYTTRSYKDMPECVAIEWLDGQRRPRHVLYHFEWESGPEPGGRGLMLRSTAEALVLARRLVDCFGGAVDDNDCDRSEVDFTQSTHPDIHATDGEAWDRWQARLMAIQPITPDEIAAYQEVAAY